MSTKRYPYTCKLLIRLDQAVYFLKNKKTQWENGKLYRVSDKGVLWQAPTHFPGFLFVWAAGIQNRFMWTRKFLSV